MGRDKDYAISKETIDHGESFSDSDSALSLLQVGMSLQRAPVVNAKQVVDAMDHLADKEEDDLTSAASISLMQNDAKLQRGPAQEVATHTTLQDLPDNAELRGLQDALNALAK